MNRLVISFNASGMYLKLQQICGLQIFEYRASYLKLFSFFALFPPWWHSFQRKFRTSFFAPIKLISIVAFICCVDKMTGFYMEYCKTELKWVNVVKRRNLKNLALFLGIHIDYVACVTKFDGVLKVSSCILLILPLAENQ